MTNENKYTDFNNDDMNINEPHEYYIEKRDFTSLEAWIRCREVKIFFYQEGIRFYRISRGSLYELKDHLIGCYDLGYIEITLKQEGEVLIESAKITLNGFINYVKSKIK